MTGKTVRDFALENPAATRIFEKLGIDYCCGGSRTLEQACHTSNLTVEQVLDSLDAASRVPAGARHEWQTAPLSEMIGHIISTHHAYVAEEIERIPRLLDKVVAAHGAKHPEVAGLRETFAGLADELRTHMMKEERILFPYIANMEAAAKRGGPMMPPPFGTVQNPVAMMLHEHDSAGEALRELRSASNGYTAPEDACTTFRTLYQALEAFEADLHQHIHLENNILFPRAIELERA